MQKLITFIALVAGSHEASVAIDVKGDVTGDGTIHKRLDNRPVTASVAASNEATVAMDVTGDGATHTVHMPRLSKLLAKLRAKDGESVTAASLLPTEELDVDAEEVISGHKEHHGIHDVDGDFDNQVPEPEDEVDSAGHHWKPINMNSGGAKDDTWLEDVHVNVFPTDYDGKDEDILAAKAAENAFRAKIDTEVKNLREHIHEHEPIREEQDSAPVSSTNLREHAAPEDDEENWFQWFYGSGDAKEDDTKSKGEVKHMREHIHEVVEETLQEDIKHMREHIHEVVEKTIKEEVTKNMREHVH